MLRERPTQARDCLVETIGDEGREILDAPIAGIGAAEQELSPN